MANIIKKVTAGQKFTPSAHEWNAIADVVNGHQYSTPFQTSSNGSLLVNAVNIGSRTIKPFELCYIPNQLGVINTGGLSHDIIHFVYPWDEPVNCLLKVKTPIIPVETLEPYPANQQQIMSSNGLTYGKAVLQGESYVAFSKNTQYLVYPGDTLDWDGFIRSNPVYPAVKFTSGILYEDDYFKYAAALVGNFSEVSRHGIFDVAIVGTDLYIWNSLNHEVFSVLTPGQYDAGTVYFANSHVTMKNAVIHNVSAYRYLYIHTTLSAGGGLSAEYEIKTLLTPSDETNQYTLVGSINYTVNPNGILYFSREMPYDNVYIQGRWHT